MLRLQNAGKSLGGRRLFRDLSLELKQGEHAVVSGPSGVGKSTLLSCIAGLAPLDEGGLFWDGVPMSRGKSGASFRLKNLGILFQEVHLVESLTVWQNLDLMAEASGSGQDPAALLAAFGLLQFSKKPVRVLSRGERQRVGLARALANGPRLLLADEPTASLDPVSRAEVLEQLWEWSASHQVSVILVSHNESLSETGPFTRRILL